MPLEKLIRRLGLQPYDSPAPLSDISLAPDRVAIPLKQHIGKPCEPVVSTGEMVERGQLIGRVPEGELGAPVHASITGRVLSVDEAVAIERT